MMMIMMTMMLMMLMQMILSFDERAARSDFTESTCIGPWANAPGAPTPLVGLLEKDFDHLQESLDKWNSKI